MNESAPDCEYRINGNQFVGGSYDRMKEVSLKNSLLYGSSFLEENVCSYEASLNIDLKTEPLNYSLRENETKKENSGAKENLGHSHFSRETFKSNENDPEGVFFGENGSCCDLKHGVALNDLEKGESEKNSGEDVPFFQRRASDGMVDFIKQIKLNRCNFSSESLFSWDNKYFLSSNEGLCSVREGRKLSESYERSSYESSIDGIYPYTSKNIKRNEAFFDAVYKDAERDPFKIEKEVFGGSSAESSDSKLVLLRNLVFSDTSSAFRSHPLFPLLKDLIIIEKFLDFSSSPLGVLISVSTPMDEVLAQYEKINRELFRSDELENATTEALKDAIKYVYNILRHKQLSY